MGPLERAKLLLSKAHDDEILIEEIVVNEKITDEIIGFHAQQAAEKLLKALLWLGKYHLEEPMTLEN